ncbi:uncharacterized protein LOC132743656 [Ruditapes philippinarum]|uniref:uncharacterized protein LOC132743656 n=1 Tax=Ruditapes philippinarum TaxID=129788 RepID=UPI00295C07AF|nr:uncharacterized protein LOC132743656 [Ruditapes philippinarum]
MLEGIRSRPGKVILAGDDRHVQIQKWIRENLVNVRHTYDVWHVAKSNKKKLTALSKQKDCEIIGKWIKSISNHVYWAAASTPDGDRETILAKWLSLSNHIQNIHNGHGPRFPSCLHGDLESRQWLKPGTKACAKVEDLITNTRLCNDIRKLSTDPQTSDLEAYHSVVNHFAPKLHSYTFHGQLCRQHLAALHFNENSKRKSAVNKDGNVAIQIAFPKYKTGDEFSIKIKREKMTYEYVESLLREVLDIADRDSGPSVLSTPAPPFLSSGKRRPCQDEISRTLSRYTKFRFGERRCLEY